MGRGLLEEGPLPASCVDFVQLTSLSLNFLILQKRDNSCAQSLSGLDKTTSKDGVCNTDGQTEGSQYTAGGYQIILSSEVNLRKYRKSTYMYSSLTKMQ